MNQSKKMPAPPADLTPEGPGRTFYDEVVGNYHALTPAELALLADAARLHDLSAELRAIVAAEGPIVPGLHGPRVHPAQVELRHAREQLRKTLAALRIPHAE